jgi:hypothetical protein
MAVRGRAMAWRGAAMAVRGTAMAVRGAAMAVRGTAMAVRGTAMAVRGTAMAWRGRATGAPATAMAWKGRAIAGPENADGRDPTHDRDSDGRPQPRQDGIAGLNHRDRARTLAAIVETPSPILQVLETYA